MKFISQSATTMMTVNFIMQDDTGSGDFFHGAFVIDMATYSGMSAAQVLQKETDLFNAWIAVKNQPPLTKQNLIEQKTILDAQSAALAIQIAGM